MHAITWDKSSRYSETFAVDRVAVELLLQDLAEDKQIKIRRKNHEKQTGMKLIDRILIEKLWWLSRLKEALLKRFNKAFSLWWFQFKYKPYKNKHHFESKMEVANIHIVSLTEIDQSIWATLWQAHQAFYQVDLLEQISKNTWHKLTDSHFNSINESYLINLNEFQHDFLYETCIFLAVSLDA